MRAGITTVMITGDHPVTAARIASDLGIVEDGQEAVAVTGHELEAMDDQRLREVVRRDLAWLFNTVNLDCVQSLADYPHVGRSVLIRYDPRDITEIRVFDHEEFICKAVNQDHHGQKVSLKEIQAARNARRRALREGINERIAVVATHTSPTPPAKAPPAPRRKLKVYKEDLR